MKILHLSIDKTFDTSENGIQAIGFKIALPDGIEFISSDDSNSIFDSVIVGMIPDKRILSIGAQNATTPILDGGEICNIEFNIDINELQLTAYDIFAKDKDDNDIELDINIDTLIVFRWTINGIWT